MDNPSRLPRWTTSRTIRFLQLLKSEEALWNPKHVDYARNKVKEKGYKKLLKDSIDIGLMEKNTDMRLLRSKIKSLKDVLRQEVIKIEASRLVAKKPEDIYQPKLAWFEDARFLNSSAGTKPFYLTASAPTAQEKEHDGDIPEIKIEIEEHDVLSEQFQENSTGDSSNADSLGTLVKSEPEDEPMLELGFLEGQGHTANEAQDIESDACSFFGKYVAAELRSLPWTTRMVVQQDIQSCIAAAVIRNANASGNSHSTKVNDAGLPHS